MSERWRSTYVEVHLPHLIHNYKLLRSCVPGARIFCPMVKGDAYGHGDVEISKALDRLNPEYLGVALVEEGVKLRRAGVAAPILVFGTFDRDAAEATVNFSLTPVLSTWAQVKVFESVVTDGEKFSVHLKFNTGMSRQGFEPPEAAQLAEGFSKQNRLSVTGVCTHFLNGEDFGVPGGRCEQQTALFSDVSRLFKGALPHYLNSSAIITRPNTTVGARPGLALYGAMPVTHDKIRADLLPVMTWKTSLALTRKIKPGETVSYMGTWTAKRETLLGLVPVGYADGYARAFSNKGLMLFRGRRVPVIGIVCMDYTLIDLTDSGSAPQPGEEVVIVGKQEKEFLKFEELAQLVGTNPYEVMTRVGPRVPRIYTH